MRNDTPYRLLCRALMQSLGLPADEAISASIGSVDGFAVLQATFPIPLDKIEKVLPIDSGLHGGKFGVVSTPSLRPASALPVDSESQSSETQPPNPEGWCSGRVDG